MIKYSFYRNNYYFVIPDIKEDWCILLIKTETISTFINLWKDRLNNNDGLNYTFYKPDYRDVESIKTFFDSVKDKKKITLVSFTKDDVDYHNEASEIVEDQIFIQTLLTSFKFHRNKTSGAYQLPPYSRFFDKDAHVKLTETAKDILAKDQILNQINLPVPLNKNMSKQGVPFGALSKSLGFDTEALIKPKSLSDVRMLLDEGIRIMNELNDSFDEIVGWKGREDFCVADKRFTQYLDKNDDAHILMLDPSIKKQMIDEQRTDLNPWVEVFVIDGNYCKFKNSYDKIVGALYLVKTEPRFIWEFRSAIPDVKYTITCTRISPYDCEREVVKEMVLTNMFESFINYGKPEDSKVCS